MSREISYETASGQFITPCPYREDVGVGGIDCSFWCRHWGGEDKGKQVITCNAPGSEGIQDK